MNAKTNIGLGVVVRLLLLSVIISFLVLLLKPLTVMAQIQCTGVDLVFLMDDSGSMARNDPSDLRVDAIEFAVNVLGNNVLYDCPNVAHRLAVVGFGTNTQVYTDTAIIAPRLDQFDAWELARAQIKDAIPDESPDLGATNFRAAFEAAAAILSRWREQPPGTGPRLRGVVLIADGGPCVPALTCSEEAFSRSNHEQYMRDMEGYLRPDGDIFPWRGSDHPDSVRIWLIAFKDITAGPEYDYLNEASSWGQFLRGSWGTITSGHGGSIVVLRSDGRNDPNANRDIGLRIAEIVDEITGSELIATTCKEPFYLDPYLDRVIIRILKIGSNPDIQLEDVNVSIVYEGPQPSARFEGGNTSGAAGKVADYLEDGPNEFYVVDDPVPGTWRIEVAGADECRDLDVRYRELPIKGQLFAPTLDDTIPQYDEGDHYDPNAPVYFQYLLYRDKDESNQEIQPIVSLPGFPLSVTVNINHDDQLIQQVQLVQEADGKWRSTEAIQTPVAGHYAWLLQAKALNGQQTEVLTRFQDSGGFDVKAVDRFHMEIVEPASQATLALNRFENGQPVAVPVRVVAKLINDVSQQPLQGDEITTATSEALLNVIVSADNVKSEPLAMAYDPAIGGWVADLVVGQNGIPAVPGNHALTVQLNRSAYNQERYRPALQNGSAATVTVVRTVVLDGELLRPQATELIPQFDEGEQFDPEMPVFLEYTLYGWHSQAISDNLGLSRYPIQLNAEIYASNHLSQTLALAPQTEGSWRATEPLKVPTFGEYRWKLTAAPATAEYKDLIIGFAREGLFNVSKVGRFHIELIEPQPTQVYPINRFRLGQQEIIPLSVAVALVDDESKENLAPEQLVSTISTTSVLSATVTLDGQSSQSIALRYNASSKRWETNIMAGDAGVPEDPGKYSLQAALAATAYDKTRYRPSVKVPDKDTVQFERVRVTPVLLQAEQDSIIQPTHVGTMGCLDAAVKPLQLRVQALNAQTKQFLDPMAITNGQGLALATVALIDPVTKNRLEENVWRLTKTTDGNTLESSLGMTHTLSGRYAVQIAPNPATLTNGYQFLDAEKAYFVEVNRTYDIWSDPMTCERGKFGGIGLLALACIGMLFNWGWRRPTGYLEVVQSRGGGTIAEKRLGRNPLLALRPRQTLNLAPDPDVGKIVIRRGNSEQAEATDPFGESGLDDDKNPRRQARAVKIIAYDPQGNVLADPTLLPGDAYPISQDLEVRYS